MDILSVLAGVAASWVVCDIIVALDERRKPWVLEPRTLPEQVKSNERMQGNFHLAMAFYDCMFTAHHAYKVVQEPRRRLYHGVQLLYGAFLLGYHTVWAYRRHRRASLAR